MGVTERERSRVRDRLEELPEAKLDADEARYTALNALRRVVGFDRWCWPLTDPATGLATSGIGELDFWPSLPRLVALEEHGDITSKPALALGPAKSVALSAVTDGDLARSLRWRECLQPYGIGDELMTACCDRHGFWGSLELMRDSGDAPFDPDEVRLLHEIAPLLGTILRRSLARSAAAARGGSPLPPATVILDRELHATSWTPALQDWLGVLPGAVGMLPPAIYELGARVLTPAGDAHRLAAHVRIRTHMGQWAMLEGATLEGADEGRVVVTVRAATADEVVDVLCRTYAFTQRERELVALVLDGLATKQLAQALSISPYTIDDHLKAIFSKAAVRSRRELVSRLTGRTTAET